MQRGDDPDRTRRAAPGTWQTGNHRRDGARRADDDPATRRNAPPPAGPPPQGPPQQGNPPQGRSPQGPPQQGPHQPGPPPQGAPQDPTRRTPPPDATRRVGPPPPPGAPPPGHGDPATARHGGPPPDGTRRMGPPPTAAYGALRQHRPDATRMMPAPVTEPELLGGRYRLEGLLGQGGMADVHRATDTRLNRPVAVKIFGAADDPTADQRFEQEAQVMANLRHPGLVAVHDFAVEPDRAYLVMELVDGPSLKDVVAREDLPPDDIRRIGTEIAQTLAYVHGQGVTHRDVKPSNVLIDSDGRARLADFGIAALLGADGHTAAGEIIGTPAYLSPEQVQGREVGPPTDVYALGLVLLESWTGRQEYQGEGLQGAAERVHRAPVVPADVPDPLRSTIAEATATDPRRRPDAHRVAEMLAAPTPAPVAPEPEPEPEQRDLGSSGAGKWIAIGAFVVALLVLLIGFLLFGGDGSDTQAPPTTESSAPPTTESSEQTSEAPTSEDGGGGFPLPSLPSNLPTELPSLPSNLPTELPSLPSNLPDPGQIGEDAQGFWDTVSGWWSRFTGGGN
ncbi:MULTISPECIES: serine/threonine-protein kinase [unclassified Pseudonocardia]|uniref:serine/threonine-protein kinase n=1 Tax=unclassified Pseudonocardia TaxID=2619320 RepID=UPI00094B4032|nr:serine/threonine-protein kinase [Pseudonocardia sp. Ae707_Ps1]OLM15985.1 serine/threonine protein kinase [Pseudonocardia sp. Ae707_Ps1]